MGIDKIIYIDHMTDDQAQRKELSKTRHYNCLPSWRQIPLSVMYESLVSKVKNLLNQWELRRKTLEMTTLDKKPFNLEK